ncbi:MAG: transglutaminase-like domain-containing protein [Gammaproteobacteria bacterium]|nr:transglutaminase-like domain-containing protein [Gammaproteobacteria bacterium]
MNKSLISDIRDNRMSFRVIAAAVLSIYVFVLYSPPAQAVKENINLDVLFGPRAQLTSEEELLADAFQLLKEKVSTNKQQLVQRVEQESGFLERTLNVFGASTLEPGPITELTTINDEILRLHEIALSDFSATEANLKEKGFSGEILQRHAEAVKKYQTEFDKLQTGMREVQAATSLLDQQNAMNNLDEFMQSQQFDRGHQAFDPEDLPFQAPKNNARRPHLTEQDYQTSLFKPEPIRIASAGSLAGLFMTASSQPGAADLAETIDVQITQAIQDLATSLDNDPVKIYNWVYDNIEFVPTYGSIQGSDMTRIARRGNAFDTSSLLIALLRAANVPARYAYGTVEIPAEQAMNWVGNVETPALAAELIGSGGIPSVAVTEGGVITKIRMEHIWVEGWIDYEPSRGGKNIEGDTWVPLDAAFKQYEYTEGVDILGVVNYDFRTFMESLVEVPIIDQNGGFTWPYETSPYGLIERDFNSFKDSALDYLSGISSNPSIDDVLGGKSIIPQAQVAFNSSSPYRIVTSGDVFSELPDALRHRATLEFFASDFDRRFGASSLTYSISLPELNFKKLGVTYIPATTEDEELIQSFIDQGAKSLPAYLINVRPSVKVDDEEMALGPVSSMGVRQYWNLSTSGPEGAFEGTKQFLVTAGDEIVFGINGNGMTQSIVENRFNAVPSDINAGENMHQVALHYWMEYDVLSSIAARSYGVHYQRLPSFGLFSSPLSVTYYFGIPRQGQYKSRIMDVQRSLISVVASDDQAGLDFTEVSGLQGSYLEGSVFDQLFQRPEGTGISAAQLLFDASEAEVPIYRIDQNNINEILPLLSVPAAVVTDIQNAVNAGKEVTVSQQALIEELGYIIKDPETGAGAYLITGGLNGGAEEYCDPDARVLVQAARLAIFIALAVLLAILFIKAMIAAGVLVGAGLAAGQPAYTTVVVFGVTITIFSGEAYADEPNPCCEPVPLGYHKGGNVVHNICADLHPPNEFPFSDVLVDAKAFDAISDGESTLWEAKTNNLKNSKLFVQGMIAWKARRDAIKESEIARQCDFKFNFVVGDIVLAALLADLQGSVIDRIDVNPLICLQPEIPR